MATPPLLGELEKYLKWEHENGLTYVNLPPFVAPQLSEPPVKPVPAEPVVRVLPRLNIPRNGNNETAGQQLLPESANSIPVDVAGQMARLRQEWANCQKCVLCQKRHKFVFGEGNLSPRLLFIGEGPGESEDLAGRPFVGRAGELLTNLIKAMGLRREQVFITNIVKCRPPNNRDPASEEVAACNPLLRRQIELLHPEVIVALGKPASHLLLNTTAPISKLRGQWFAYQGIPLLPTFHPAYLLRNPADKGKIWEDMCAVLIKLGLPVPQLPKKSR